jgi:hypothetical protein
MNGELTSSGLIDRKIHTLRRAFARHELQFGLLRVLTLILAATFLIVVVEGFRYFDGNVRRDIVFFLAAFQPDIFGVPFIWNRQIIKRKISAYDDYHLARMIGDDQPDVRDDC